MADSDLFDIDSLKLTVDNKGIVWYSLFQFMSENSKDDVTSFVKSKFIEKAKRIRVTGNQCNVELIQELFKAKTDRRFERLELCSPLSCRTSKDRQDPELVLYHMRNFKQPSSLGGYHECSAKDFVAYSLACHFKSACEDGPYVTELINHFGPYQQLQFIPYIGRYALAKLIGLILDPRWYIEPYSDGNEELLYYYLGLSNKGQGDVEKARRYRIVLDTWKNPNNDLVITEDPRNFLWRIWQEGGGGDKGDLAASRVFMSYFRQIWLANICNQWQAHLIFAPECFFVQPDEKDEFVKYIESHPF